MSVPLFENPFAPPPAATPDTRATNVPATDMPATDALPPRWRTKDLVVGAVAFLVLVGGGGTAVALNGDDAGTSAGPRVFTGEKFGEKSAPAPPVNTGPADLNTVLPGLKAYVAKTRGLEFTKDVPITLLDDEAFGDALRNGDKPTAAEQQQREASVSTWLALDLVDSREDADDQAEASLDSILGFYDDEKDELFVRADKGLTPYAQETLVHELTHALQDQHFDLSPAGLDGATDERALAFAALVEGDATWVEYEWYNDQPAAVQDAIDDEEEDLFGDSWDDEPTPYDLYGYFPYAVGVDLVDQLRDAGGQARLDAAFTSPPTTSAQVLDIDADPAVTVPAPSGRDAYGVVPAGGKIVETGVIGEAGLALLLDEDPSDPDIASAWRGDSYATAEVDGQVCISVDFVFDSPTHAKKLLKALNSDFDAFAQGPTGVALRSCVKDSSGTGA